MKPSPLLFRRGFDVRRRRRRSEPSSRIQASEEKTQPGGERCAPRVTPPSARTRGDGYCPVPLSRFVSLQKVCTEGPWATGASASLDVGCRGLTEVATCWARGGVLGKRGAGWLADECQVRLGLTHAWLGYTHLG
jgi:hypothetical protein